MHRRIDFYGDPAAPALTAHLAASGREQMAGYKYRASSRSSTSYR